MGHSLQRPAVNRLLSLERFFSALKIFILDTAFPYRFLIHFPYGCAQAYTFHSLSRSLSERRGGGRRLCLTGHAQCSLTILLLPLKKIGDIDSITQLPLIIIQIQYLVSYTSAF